MENIFAGIVEVKKENNDMKPEECRNLFAEWKDCDSLKRRDEIKKIVYDSSTELLHRLNRLYRKYGMKYVDDIDYSESRGSITICIEYLEDDEIRLKYEDSWCRGGYCDINITIPVKYFDDSELDALEIELRSKRIEILKKEIEKNLQQIEELKQSVEDDKSELERLEKK